MNVTILDGGLGQELIARSGKATSLWSVQALIDDPALVKQVHADYFAAGAEIATTNTYSLLPDRLDPHGLNDQLESLTEIACEQALAARDTHGSGLIAGSMGPQGFSYQPDKCPPASEASKVYERVCSAQQAYVDFFIAETMASVDQIRGAINGASKSNKPLWVAMTVDDIDGTRLRSGESVIDALPLLRDSSVTAVLVNCSVPEAVTQAIPILSEGVTVPIGAYANGFSEINKNFNKVGATVDLLKAREDLGPAAYAAHAEQWISDGASIIGGCCEVGPDHIAELKRRFS